MATKARSGSARSSRPTSKTSRMQTASKSKAVSGRRGKKQKGLTISHHHLIGGMIALAILMTGMIGYVSANLTPVSHAASATATGEIKGVGGNCLDNQSARVANKNKIQMYRCNNTVAQKWSVFSDGSLRVQGYCLDIPAASKSSGTVVQLYRCNNTVAQKWSVKSNGTIVNPNSGLCLDVRYGNTSNGALVQIYTCNNTAAQKWTVPAVATAPAPAPMPSPAPSPEPTAPAPAPATGSTTGGSGGSRTNQTFQKYSANGYTSQYHLYAGGLDWTKPVGALIYADGSGEYGLKNPGSSYLLSGANGMIAVAKKHNMILITPFSPNKACADGDGSCWYMGDSVGYTKWAESLVQNIYSKYPINKNRVAFGGYSSGAQLATEYWTPSGAAQRTMNDGVIVAISYGGSPKMSQVAYTGSFKSNVHFNWNTGSKDEAYTRTDQYGVKGGYNSYTNAGFKTSLDVISGLGHGRSGQFGGIMDAQIREHVN